MRARGYAAGAIVLVLLGACVVALATSWSEPHAPLMALVGLAVALGLQLAWYSAWRRSGRSSSAVLLTAGLFGVLSMSFVCYGEGWLRAFGAAALLPVLAGVTFAVVRPLAKPHHGA